MAENTPQDAAGKGKAFFDRADQVADTGNWDFAIEMYIEGLKREPGNLDRGHKPLRETAMKRKAQGGKGPGMMEGLKRRPGKDPAENLANAAYLLAKEPGSVPYMEQLLTAAQALKLDELAKWVCDILLESQRQTPKPNKRVLLALTQAYNDLTEYGLAIQACEMARQLTPNDPVLHDAIQELGAKYTIKKGKYDQEGSFTKGVKDLSRQQELIQKDYMIQSEDYLKQQIERAREEYQQTPTVPGKVNALVDALLKFEDESYENEAVDILHKAHKDTGAPQFKMRVGDIRIRQMTRRYRKLVAAGDKEAAREHGLEQLKFEIQEYAERAENYPTDLSLKFELGRRLLLAGKYDEAIGALQQAQREPRRATQAMNYLGQAFARKGWLREAAETFERALANEMPEDRVKEIRYHFGDVLEQMGELQKARDQFSQVAQMEFNYRDVRDRLETVRKKLQGEAEESK
ncbi:MAG TPA: hypothetical protein DCX07_08965 [Phycisphaerales bacterium]|nr:hypothetical protein [Phycisphaerales bacterium]